MGIFSCFGFWYWLHRDFALKLIANAHDRLDVALRSCRSAVWCFVDAYGYMKYMDCGYSVSRHHCNMYEQNIHF